MNHSSPAFPKIYLLGGLTGSGKTELLHHLFTLGEQVLDLETLCCHDGSAFAPLRYTSQPTSYQFHKQLNKACQKFDADKPLFIEQELQRIGNLTLPDWLYSSMVSAPLIWLDTLETLRIQRLSKLIRQSDPFIFCDCLQKLSDRMDRSITTRILEYFSEGNIEKVVSLLLDYYDNSNGYAKKDERIIATITVQSLQMKDYGEEVLMALNPNLRISG